jgi:hypothetical protein
METYSATLLDTLPQDVVPLVLRPTLNLLPDILDVSDHVFPVVRADCVLDTGVVVLLLLLTRADSTSGLLARAGRGDGRLGDTVSGVGEEVAEEVERVGEEVAEFGGGEEDGEEGGEGVAGFLEFVFRGDGDVGEFCATQEGQYCTRWENEEQCRESSAERVEGKAQKTTMWENNRIDGRDEKGAKETSAYRC